MLASRYLEGLFSCLFDSLAPSQISSCLQTQLRKFSKESHTHFKQYFTGPLNYSPQTLENKNIFVESLKTIKQLTALGNSFLEILPLEEEQVNFFLDYFNHLYKNAFWIHHYALIHLPNTAISYPRCQGATLSFPQEDCGLQFFMDQKCSLSSCTEFKTIPKHPLYTLEFSQIQALLFEEQSGISTNSYSSLELLEQKREQKFEEFLAQGKCFLEENNFKKAKECFLQASQYKNDPEGLTLLGHCFYSLNDLYKAIRSCLLAIKISPEYGPALNDLGNYYLLSGDLEEAKKWFEETKYCPSFTHREYPYISMGRIYLLEKKYEEALKEFKKAKLLAPMNETLQDLIAQVRQSSLELYTEELWPLTQ